MKLFILCICIPLCLLSGCTKTPKEYSTHGISLITMDSKWKNECSGIDVDVHRKMANWIINNEGAKSDPTYKANSNSWKTGKNKENDQKECIISSLEFIDANNNTNMIKTICIYDKGLLLIECTSTDDQTTIALRNEIVSTLNSKGFKCI